jgi:hypothetical protein
MAVNTGTLNTGTLNTGTVSMAAVSVLVSDMPRSQAGTVQERSPIPRVEMGLVEIAIC